MVVVGGWHTNPYNEGTTDPAYDVTDGLADDVVVTIDGTADDGGDDHAHTHTVDVAISHLIDIHPRPPCLPF